MPIAMVPPKPAIVSPDPPALPSQTGLSPAFAPARDRIDWWATILFFAVQATALLGVAKVGWSASGALLCAALYFVRMFGVTAGFHRYFAHRSYKMGRVTQFLLALVATTSSQQGVLWWAAHHRFHHKHSDQPRDVHSPKQRGFLWAHCGWFLVWTHNDTRWQEIKDFAAFPELRILNRFHLLPSFALALALLLIGGPKALLWGYFVSTSLLWHGTFALNSIGHWLGQRRYATRDESRNNGLVALLTLGDGWHNNHHYYPRAVNHGFYWWEIDVTYYLLCGLAALGLVWDLKRMPLKLRDREPAPVGVGVAARSS